jgi:hypothetical protein
MKLLSLIFLVALAGQNSPAQQRPGPDMGTARPISSSPEGQEETEVARRGAASSIPAMTAKTNASDRDYYQQLYAADGFTHESFATAPDGSKISLGRMPNADYVCFSDNAYSGTFFTFNADAYDENYSKAWDNLERLSAAEWEKQRNIQQAIQQTAPYVHFITRPWLDAYPPDIQQFFRRGGRHLEETVYEKGVKINTLDYEWDGNSWFLPFPPTDPNAYTRKSEVLHLAIEPNTMRYIDSMTVTITVGRGEAATDTSRHGSQAGVCEKIPDPK